MRPFGSNADEWALFLEEHHEARPFVAVQIATAIEEAVAHERNRCLGIVLAARFGDINQDFRNLESLVRNGTQLGVLIPGN